jgi:hypothetical protein
MKERYHYYYLHTNGDLIHKPASVLVGDPDYFDSPFVQKVWVIDMEDRITAYSMLLNAQALGANLERVNELKEKWFIDDVDLEIFIEKSDLIVEPSTNPDLPWVAHTITFVDKESSLYGEGKTKWDALVALSKDTFTRTKVADRTLVELLSLMTLPEGEVTAVKEAKGGRDS